MTGIDSRFLRVFIFTILSILLVSSANHRVYAQSSPDLEREEIAGFKKAGDVSSRNGLVISVRSPSCWSEDKLKGKPLNTEVKPEIQCPQKMQILFFDRFEREGRVSYSLKIDQMGLIELSLETKPGLFDWVVYRGRLPDSCTV